MVNVIAALVFLWNASALSFRDKQRPLHFAGSYAQKVTPEQ
jgi:hypothetical protein